MEIELHDFSEEYPRDFFQARMGYRSPYYDFARAIEKVFEPVDLIDVGCGVGFILEHFVGKIPVLGFDGSMAALDLMRPEVRRCSHWMDLRRHRGVGVGEHIRKMSPWDWKREPWDFAVCIEVGEHLPESDAGWLVADLCDVARRVFFTAAPPGQRGRAHLNCQPPEYWIDRFEDQWGFLYRPEMIDAWRKNLTVGARVCPWVVKNAMYFEKEAV